MGQQSTALILPPVVVASAVWPADPNVLLTVPDVLNRGQLLQALSAPGRSRKHRLAAPPIAPTHDSNIAYGDTSTPGLSLPPLSPKERTVFMHDGQHAQESRSNSIKVLPKACNATVWLTESLPLLQVPAILAATTHSKCWICVPGTLYLQMIHHAASFLTAPGEAAVKL